MGPRVIKRKEDFNAFLTYKHVVDKPVMLVVSITDGEGVEEFDEIRFTLAKDTHELLTFNRTKVRYFLVFFLLSFEFYSF